MVAKSLPPARRLRVFALDPGLGSSVRTFESRIATVSVPFEARPDGASILEPGPVGEYLEIVDVDPASDRYYPPVDLNQLHIVAQDGLTPSEGNPQFHQQMVYAIAMRTISLFEEALGRKALWASPAPRSGKAGDSPQFVQRLRLFPHALRARNAFYSPDRRAILFGYFPSEASGDVSAPTGTMVFACLSSDIIAHEMTHALLDGAARGYREPSNPDVLAFHEAFADIVALFQHFSYRDLVRREIAQARGAVNSATLLGGLARQFGEASSRSGALRDYVNFPAEISYRNSFEVHDRGSLLVKAVYDAFLTIVERRTGDLIRLATGGSGILKPGALHPDLVDRLADETGRAARHVLRICIRAIDFCPPVDITFGSYLRALITSDLAHVAEDRYNYRTAFLESFRRLDLLPSNLRTVSIETLCWRQSAAWSGDPAEAMPNWLDGLIEAVDIDWRSDLSRKQIFERAQARKDALHDYIAEVISTDPAVAGQLGLIVDLPRFCDDGSTDAAWRKEHEHIPHATCFEVETVRAARRVRPDGLPREEIVIVILQERPQRIDPHDLNSARFWQRGGVTLIIDPQNAENRPEILYAVTRDMRDDHRLARERAYRANPLGGGMAATYLADPAIMAREPFAMLHGFVGLDQ